MSTLIEFKNASRFFHDKQALVGVNCRVEQGEMVFLTGHSGAGKSTFLKLLALHDHPCEGKVLVNDYSLADLSEEGANMYRRKIGFVQQSPRFIEDFNISENIALPLRLRGYSYPDAQRRVRSVLFKVGLLQRAQDYFHVLSGGERQRAEIARSLVHNPMILLADEPTGNLDRAMSIEIMNLLVDLNKLGTTVIVATHDDFLLRSYAYRVFKLNKGTFREYPTYQERLKENLCEQ